jgi:hypothetical protein
VSVVPCILIIVRTKDDEILKSVVCDISPDYTPDDAVEDTKKMLFEKGIKYKEIVAKLSDTGQQNLYTKLDYIY